jgi:hypothetical protein
VSSVPPHEPLPENIAYLAQLPWPAGLPATPVRRDTWPPPADQVDLDALATYVLADADRRRQDAFTLLWDCYQVFGPWSAEVLVARRAWKKAFSAWSEVYGIVQELTASDLHENRSPSA